MEKIRLILRTHGYTLLTFSRKLKVSRPTLYSYIEAYINNKPLPNKHYDILFHKLFDNPIPTKLFTELLENFQTENKDLEILEREKRFINNLKRKSKSKRLNKDCFEFLDLFIEGYGDEILFSHICDYFLLLNGKKTIEDFNFQKNPFVLYYFETFFKDRKGLFEFDQDLYSKFCDRVKETVRLKERRKEEIANQLLEDLQNKINLLNYNGIDITIDDILYKDTKLKKKY